MEIPSCYKVFSNKDQLVSIANDDNFHFLTSDVVNNIVKILRRCLISSWPFFCDIDITLEDLQELKTYPAPKAMNNVTHELFTGPSKLVLDVWKVTPESTAETSDFQSIVRIDVELGPAQGYRRLVLAVEKGFSEAMCGNFLCAQMASHTCGRCKRKRYCSPACQREDWTFLHKHLCIKKENQIRGSKKFVKIPVENNEHRLRLIHSATDDGAIVMNQRDHVAIMSVTF